MKHRNDQLDAVWNYVSAVCRVPLSTATDRSRKMHFVRARNLFYYFARTYTFATWKQIAEYTGRDHSTAIHGYENIDRECAYDKKLQRVLKEISDEIQGYIPDNVDILFERDRAFHAGIL